MGTFNVSREWTPGGLIIRATHVDSGFEVERPIEDWMDSGDPLCDEWVIAEAELEARELLDIANRHSNARRHRKRYVMRVAAACMAAVAVAFAFVASFALLAIDQPCESQGVSVETIELLTTLRATTPDRWERAFSDADAAGSVIGVPRALEWVDRHPLRDRAQRAEAISARRYLKNRTPEEIRSGIRKAGPHWDKERLTRIWKTIGGDG